jgi:hypothetical protein
MPAVNRLPYASSYGEVLGQGLSVTFNRCISNNLPLVSRKFEPSTGKAGAPLTDNM